MGPWQHSRRRSAIERGHGTKEDQIRGRIIRYHTRRVAPQLLFRRVGEESRVHAPHLQQQRRRIMWMKKWSGGQQKTAFETRIYRHDLQSFVQSTTSLFIWPRSRLLFLLLLPLFSVVANGGWIIFHYYYNKETSSVCRGVVFVVIEGILILGHVMWCHVIRQCLGLKEDAPGQIYYSHAKIPSHWWTD